LGAKLAILLLLSSLLADSAYASVDSCAPVITPTGNVRQLPMDIYNESTVLELLKMFGQLRNHNEGFSSKNTKKEMTLGKNLKAGYSLEMKFEYDERDDVKAYNYLSLDLIHPDGFKENLSKRPVNPVNWSFFEESIDVNGPVGKFEVNVPMKIEGPLIDALEKWGNRLNFIDASDLRKLSTMSDLRWLYLKYFKEDQKDLYKNRSRKEYSKIIFSVGLIIAVNYFTFSKKKEGQEDDPNHAELFNLLLQFEGPRTWGITETEKKEAELEQLGGAPTLSKSFVDREPPAGLNRIVTVLEFSKLETIFVTEYVYFQGKRVEANALIVQKGDRAFTLLARALRAE
jgi:hypothetical protein